MDGSVIGGAGILVLALAVFFVVLLTVLGILMPWFVFRIYHYQKEACHHEKESCKQLRYLAALAESSISASGNGKANAHPRNEPLAVGSPSQWRVHGVDRETGEQRELLIKVNSEDDAVMEASRQGVLTERADRIE